MGYNKTVHFRRKYGHNRKETSTGMHCRFDLWHQLNGMLQVLTANLVLRKQHNGLTRNLTKDISVDIRSLQNARLDFLSLSQQRDAVRISCNSHCSLGTCRKVRVSSKNLDIPYSITHTTFRARAVAPDRVKIATILFTRSWAKSVFLRLASKLF